MSDKTYNNIIALLSFLATIGFIICKIIGLITASWWFVIVPFFLAIIFRVEENDNYHDDENNLKMA